MSLNKYRVRLSKNDQKLKIRRAWFKTGTAARSKLINLKKGGGGGGVFKLLRLCRPL